MIGTLAVENYRSLRRLVVPLRRLNVVTGENGSGKSNLDRALRLLAASAVMVPRLWVLLGVLQPRLIQHGHAELTRLERGLCAVAGVELLKD